MKEGGRIYLASVLVLAACGRAQSSGGNATGGATGLESGAGGFLQAGNPSRGGAGGGVGVSTTRGGSDASAGTTSEGGAAIEQAGANTGGEAEVGHQLTFEALLGESATWGARSIAVGDLNLDGKPDLVVDRGDDYLGVRLATSNGNFAHEVRYWLGLSPTVPASIAIGDMDADGAPDLVADTGSSFDDIRMLFNEGDGTFKASIKLSSGRSIYSGRTSIVVADLNADTRLDIALGGGAVLLNQGQRTFGAAQQYPSQTTSGVAAADIDGDGMPDLVLANGAAIQVAPDERDGTFSLPTSYATTGEVRSLAVTDLNGDGRPDVVAVMGSTSDEVAVFLGQAGGKLQNAVYYPAGPLPYAVAAGDLDGDGSPELVFASYDPSMPFSILVNDGHGVFSAPQEFAKAPGRGLREALVVADLNGDGKQDLAVVGQSDAEEMVFINTTRFAAR